MLDVLRLRVLAAIAAHGSVTKAAKQLNYSQPAVSHHLATYGDPPNPPATTAFITALHHAVEQTQSDEPTPSMTG